MKAIKNILIPTDFSENSMNAIRYALDYFEDIPVNFFMLHVQGTELFQKKEEDEIIFENTETLLIQDPKTQMDEQIKICYSVTKNPLHQFNPLLGKGRLAETIRHYVKEKEVDYIVMGTKGTSKITNNEIGSNTGEVITKVKCPILVIPEHAKFQGIRNMAFLTDYNCLYRSKIITTLSETLDLQKSALRILHSRTPNASLTPAQVDNKGFLHYFFRETKHSFHLVENKNMETGIQDFVETWDIKLLAIVAKNLNFIQRLLLRPAAETIDYHTELPFLVIHE